MNQNDLDHNGTVPEGEEPIPSRPKPLRKLVRVDKSRTQADPQPDRYQAPPAQGYQPSHEAPAQQYHGLHEAPPSSEQGYHGKYEASPSTSYRGKYEADPVVEPVRDHSAYTSGEQDDAQPEYYENDGDEYNGRVELVQAVNKGSAKDVIVKIAAIAASLFIIGALILNMPIFLDRKTQDNVSLIYLIKHWQPLNKEGELSSNTMELNVDTAAVEDDYSDGLDLPQLIEGQYSVLLLGFDEDVFNTDVMWVLQFDIGHGKLNILQIPRDCCLPDYTTSVTKKFNSVYSMGDPTIQPPIQRVVNAVQENFGIPIDAYVTTVCYDIVDMVDIIGGIPMHLDNEIVYEADKIIPAGDVVLTGEQAEWFIRFRREWLTGDIGRMQNQRRFMAAAMQKLLSIVRDEGRVKLYSYLKQIYDNEYVYTDLSLDSMAKVADFASTLSMDNVQVNMVPGEGAMYYASDGNEYDVYSVHKQATIDMLNKYYRPYQLPMTYYDTSIVELITNYEYTGYDDTSATLDELEDATEPARDPNKKQ